MPIPTRPARGPLLAPLLLCLVLLLAAGAAPARAQVPPDVRWTTLETAHFRVHFTPGLEEAARRAGAHGERAWTALEEMLVDAPGGKVDLLLADNVDFANGYATPFPSRRIVVYAHPPTDEPTLSFFDDWLGLVVAHELVHVFHLEHAEGLPRLLRTVLGRNPAAFPNAYVPGWVVEGIATSLESRMTGAGRVRGTVHEMMLRTAVLEDAFLPIDRATGGPVAWPGPRTEYVYGSMFVDWLERRRGAEKTGELVRTVGGSVLPYALDAHARGSYGVSFTSAWAEWEAELRARYAALADSLRAEGLTEPEVLTDGGRETEFPRWSPDGAWIAYATSTGRDPASTRAVRPDGTGERVLARRTTLGPAAWTPDGAALYTAQVDAVDPYRYLADLYRVDARQGGDRRLTRGARLREPDVAPDGRRLVVVASAGATNVLAVVDPATGARRALTRPSLDTAWALPRWSPDGTRIAAARWRRGGFFDVVVLDSAGRLLREVTADRAVDDAPAWSPDGRYVVFSSDRSGIANLYAHEWETGVTRRVTHVLTGAFQPDVSPDGRWIAFAWYRADGYHVARIPFDPSRWRAVPPLRPGLGDTLPGAPIPPPARAAGPARPYSPWRSLAPRAWTPLFATGDDALGATVGAAVGSEDLVGRHAYGVWAQAHTDDLRVDAGAAYQFRGLGTPVLGVSAFQDWDVLVARGGLVVDGAPVQSALLERERSVALTATLLRPRFLSYGWLSGGVGLRGRERAWDQPDAPGVAGVRLSEVPLEVGGAVSAGYSTVQEMAYSISPERGWLAAATVEGRRYLEPFGDDPAPAGYARTLGRVHAFAPLALGGFSRHVLGVRAAVGGEYGSRAPGLRVGGTGGIGTPVFLGADLGLGDALDFPVRGYEEGDQRGDRAFSATAEYRFPLFLVERGVRVLPLFVDRVWGTVFADAGSAWCVEACDPDLAAGRAGAVRPLVSTGAELVTRLRVGYALGLDVRAGVAVPLRARGAGGEPPPPVAYVRLGRSF